MRHSAGTWSGKTSEVPHIPFRAGILGCSFPERPHRETMALNSPACPHCANLLIEHRCMFALSCMVKIG